MQGVGEKERTNISLDDQTVLNAALADTIGFERGLDIATINESKRAPELLPAINKSID